MSIAAMLLGVQNLPDAKLSCGHYYNGEHVEESGLIYLRARYYDASVGQFIQIDKNYKGEENDSATHNRYNYTLSNPYKYVDRDGNIFKKVIKVAVKMTDIALKKAKQKVEKEKKAVKKVAKAAVKKVAKLETPPAKQSINPARGLINYLIEMYGNLEEAMAIICPEKNKEKESSKKAYSSETYIIDQIRVCTDGALRSEYGPGTKYGSEYHQDQTAFQAYAPTPADQIPYIVIPGNYEIWAWLGSIGTVEDMGTGQKIYAIISEVGPEENGMGEVSMKALWMLNYDKDDANGKQAPPGRFRITIYGSGLNKEIDWKENPSELYGQIEREAKKRGL